MSGGQRGARAANLVYGTVRQVRRETLVGAHNRHMSAVTRQAVAIGDALQQAAGVKLSVHPTLGDDFTSELLRRDAVDFEATVTLDVLDQSVHALSFTASQPISVLSVQVDGQAANFRAATDDGGQSRFLFETSTPLTV